MTEDKRVQASAKQDGWRGVAGVVLVAGGAFEAAFEWPRLCWLMLVFLPCLCFLARRLSPRAAFYTGFGLGVAIYATQLLFFWGIFGLAAIAMWGVAAIWLAVFLLMASSAYRQLPRVAWVLLLPVLWTGLEYFRSELYYLRFSWLTPGFAFSQVSSMQWLGVYGIGFILVLLSAALLSVTGRRQKMILPSVCLLAVVALTASLQNWRSGIGANPAAQPGPLVVGVQLEGAGERRIVQSLNEALGRYPEMDLVVLSEYSFFGPPPTEIRKWCQGNRKYLVVGGTAAVPENREEFYNTAYVIGPDGEVVFTQGKSVPIQFFTDGLPAQRQRLWESPWGKLGICICYDLSYSRVTDRLIRMGAEGLIVPTMDVKSWGAREHMLHSRIGPIRAAEYRVPVVRVCSSGISQVVLSGGEVLADAPYPGQGEIVGGRIGLQTGRLPVDRYLAPWCVGVTGAAVIGLWVNGIRVRRKRAELLIVAKAEAPR